MPSTSPKELNGRCNHSNSSHPWRLSRACLVVENFGLKSFLENAIHCSTLMILKSKRIKLESGRLQFSAHSLYDLHFYEKMFVLSRFLFFHPRIRSYMLSYILSHSKTSLIWSQDFKYTFKLVIGIRHND